MSTYDDWCGYCFCEPIAWGQRMPELRSGRRRRRAPISRKRYEPVVKYVKTRAAVAAEKKQEQEKLVIVISETDSDVKKEREEIKGVMGDESGGFSANKGVPPEDEGNTPPFPERV